MNKIKVYVAGHTGLVGSAVYRRLRKSNNVSLITATSKEVNLINQADTHNFIKQVRPDYIVMCAARVGGIFANIRYPYNFIYDNLMMQSNVINSARVVGTKKIIFLGSSCIYPRDTEYPIKEEKLLTSPLEETNKSYAIAKIAGIQLCNSCNKQFGIRCVALMPTNLYGPFDNFSKTDGHVLPALIAKLHEAKINNRVSITLPGNGSSLREFLHVDDLSEAIAHVCFSVPNEFFDSNDTLINVGTGKEITIKNLAKLIKDIVAFRGKILWDKTSANGTHRKVIDSTRIHLTGWRPKITLRDGIGATYDWYKRNYNK